MSGFTTLKTSCILFPGRKQASCRLVSGVRRSLEQPGNGASMKFWIRLAKLCFSPAWVWNDLRQDARPVVAQYVQWLLPLTLLALLVALGSQALHQDYSSWNELAQLAAAMLWVAVVLVVQLTAVAFVLHIGAPLLGGTRDLRQSFALSFHASTGIVLGAVVQLLVLALFPLPLVLGAAWSIYLLLTGMPALLNMPPSKSRILGVVIVLLFMLISVLLSPLVERVRRDLQPISEQLPGAELLTGGATAPEANLPDSVASLLQANRNLDRAADEAGTASAHNDPLAEAQAARDAVNAMAAGAAGGAHRLPLTVTELTDWFPASIMDMKLRALQLEPWGGLSSQAIMARASYAPATGRDRELELSVLDPASAGSLLAESAASSGHDQREGETDVTVERSYREGGRVVSEVLWKGSTRVEITSVLVNGVRVMAKANGVELEDLRAAVRSLSYDALEKNRLVPVRNHDTVGRNGRRAAAGGARGDAADGSTVGRRRVDVPPSSAP